MWLYLSAYKKAKMKLMQVLFRCISLSYPGKYSHDPKIGPSGMRMVIFQTIFGSDFQMVH
jgi:hypothetical protein